MILFCNLERLLGLNEEEEGEKKYCIISSETKQSKWRKFN